MKIYYFNLKRKRGRLILLLLALVGLVLGNNYLKSSELTTLKKYQPIYQGNGEGKKIALICNVVWGEEFIPEMLSLLRKKDVKITYFIGGQWAEKFPELTELIDKEGHEIGNHGYAHQRPSSLSEWDNWEEIRKTEEIIYKITKKKTKLFHPPYRDQDNRVVEIAGEKGYITIMSSVDTIDWQRPDPQVIVERVTLKIHNGAIVLMHPTAPTIRALPQIIDKLKAQGYQIVTVSELLANPQNTHNP
ncbi:MAG: polysaccharide deacetylase family protein [Carboxydocellales bacterium]